MIREQLRHNFKTMEIIRSDLDNLKTMIDGTLDSGCFSYLQL